MGLLNLRGHGGCHCKTSGALTACRGRSSSVEHSSGTSHFLPIFTAFTATDVTPDVKLFAQRISTQSRRWLFFNLIYYSITFSFNSAYLLTVLWGFQSLVGVESSIFAACSSVALIPRCLISGCLLYSSWLRWMNFR